MSTDIERNRALCAAWIDWMRTTAHRAPLTCDQYARSLESLVAWTGERPLDTLVEGDLEEWVGRARVRRAHGQVGSAATQAKDVHVLRGLYGWARQRGLMVTNPAERLVKPTIKNAMPRAIDPPVWAQVWRSKLTTTERIALGLGFYCGLRRSEITSITSDHIDRELGRIVGFKRKGDRNERVTGVFPYRSSCLLFDQKAAKPLRGAAALVEALEAAEGPLVGWSADMFNKNLLGILRRSGVPEHAFTPHALRHSYVTYTLQMGVPIEVVSRLANHANIATTTRYVKVASDPLAAFLGQPIAGLRP